MATWIRIQELPDEYQRQILSIYNQNFPIEIRMQLAEWIEQQDWSYYAKNNFDSAHCQLVADFSEQIRQLLTQTNDISVKFKFTNFLSILSNASQINDIIKCIDDCLKYEQKDRKSVV